jgi:hypothetical protein
MWKTTNTKRVGKPKAYNPGLLFRDSNVQHVVNTHDVTAKKNGHFTGIDVRQLKISYVFPLMLNGWPVASATGDIQLRNGRNRF